MVAPALRKWLAFGSGIGIAIEGARGAESLHIAAVRVRPTGGKVVGTAILDDFRNRPAAEWGAEYSTFLNSVGMQHVAATVLLPRHEVILRQLSLPGVADKDLDAAVAFQLDGLHPYDEADVVASWARLEGSDAVAVAIARKEQVDGYATLFAEAGIKLAGFTCSGPAIFSALRVRGSTPASDVFAVDAWDRGIEVYGESPAKPLLSVTFPLGENESPERVLSLTAAELRIENAPEPIPLMDLVAAEPPRAYAAAVTSACPMLSVPLNLLPADQRETRSAWQWIPTAALAAAVLLVGLALALFQNYRNGAYLETLNSEIAKVQPAAQRTSNIDRQIEDARNRTVLLDQLRGKEKLDMDVLAELTKLLPPPTWIQNLAMDGSQVSITGETDQAALLLKTLDESPLFEGSEFISPPARGQGVEIFNIRTKRSGVAR